MRTPTLAVTALAIIVTSIAVRADSITESFSLSIPSTILDSSAPNGGENFPTTTFAQFNPARGTLTSITATLTGPATWIGPSFILNASLLFTNNVEVGVGGFQSFLSQGAINFSMSTEDTFPEDLPLVIGTGTTNFDLNLEAPGDAFSTTSPGLTGTVSYNYVPSSVTPEPGSLALLLEAAAVMGLFVLQRRKSSSLLHSQQR